MSKARGDAQGRTSPGAPTRKRGAPPHKGRPFRAVWAPGRQGRWSYLARSKSIALYARSLLSRCSDRIWRTVPDLERITIDSVVAVSER